VSRSPAVFDEQKLSWMNGNYIREMGTEELTRLTAALMAEQGLPGADDPRLAQAVGAVQEKVSTLNEIPRLIGFAFAPVETDPAAWEKVMGKEGARESLQRVREALADVDPFDEQHVEDALRRVAEDTGSKPGKLFQPIRVAITGKTVSAGIFESLALLGRDESLARIDAAIARA
jgi:glutamyl-tRNA synthetase